MAEAWFEVDKDGLKALQLGKPKFHAIREMIQNAIDEKITKCIIESSYYHKIATFSVEDDGPGYRDIKDAYTMFKTTYKQENPELRGRWNMGNKQLVCISNSAIVETVSGVVTFDKNGKTVTKKSPRTIGTKITIELNMTKQEYQECLDFVKTIIYPNEITITLNSEIIQSVKPFRAFETQMKTEKLTDGQFTPTVRKTKIELFELPDKYLYEMGIPVCPIECDYGINVQQRIPMGIDRDAVSQAYLKDLFAEVLNNTIDIISPDSVSQSWVRIGMTDNRVTGDAVKTVIKHRFGDKTVIANPTDALSIDDAISSGYNVVYGREMSKEEWDNVKKHDVMKSSTAIFGRTICDSERIEPTLNMEKVAKLTKKIAKEIGGFNVKVVFMKSKATCMAQYGNNIVTFNVSNCGNKFFDKPLSNHVLELIIHELCHEYGHHTEARYHQAICEWSGKLIILALNNPSWFNEFKVVQ